MNSVQILILFSIQSATSLTASIVKRDLETYLSLLGDKGFIEVNPSRAIGVTGYRLTEKGANFCHQTRIKFANL